jgi:hypothetical protein
MVLHRDPWVFSKAHKYTLGSQESPWKENGESNWVPGHGETAAPANPGEPAAGTVGEIVGKACGLTLGRFVTGVGVERPPASAGGDAEMVRPPRPKCWRSAGQGAT